MSVSVNNSTILDRTPAPQPGKLFIESLTVDERVQRSIDPARIRKMLEEGFRPNGLGSIVVSHRSDDSHHVIDGQHRVELCKQFGYLQPLDCLIYRNLTLAAEAEMFLVLNDRRSVQPIDKFKVRVEAQDPVAVALNELLARYGWTVRNGKSKGYFGAISALEKIYTGWGKTPTQNIGICESVISIVSAAWDNNADGAQHTIITGLGMIFMKYGDRISIEKLTNELIASGNPRALVGQARSLQSLQKGRVADSMASILVNMANKRCTKNRLPDWMSE